MKRAAGIVPLLLAGCAGNPAVDGGGAAARCENTSCFSEHQVREFEVVDRDTVIVYTGAQRCPFVLELGGVTCDVAFAPDIEFLQSVLGSANRAAPVSGGRVCDSTHGLYLYAGIVGLAAMRSPEPMPGGPTRDGRRGGGLDPFGGAGVEGGSLVIDPASRDLCRVDGIRSATDDELLELYVDAGIAPPPPPVGSGEIEVPAGGDGEGGDGGAAPEPTEAPAVPDAADPQP